MSRSDDADKLSQIEIASIWVDIVAGALTAVGVAAAGIWAYYKLAKGRTFQPRTLVDLSAKWIEIEGRWFLIARIDLTNIGSSHFYLRQTGTGLRFSLPDLEDPKTEPHRVAWERKKTFSILKEHKWIEPGEASLRVYSWTSNAGGPRPCSVKLV
ncbi:hypothetical protein [Jiangella muralis]|uniref:hypothetical protein n=1 Tax=Jiangella muralis TaxID=702383 RepID=UPI0012F7B001|nr:hypothetical protein [Jiangella muralis]